MVAVEDDERWSEGLKARLPSHCALLQEADLHRFVDAIYRYPEGFDIIVIDGPARDRTRLKCANAALKCLKPGGMIILDNADWLPEFGQAAA